ncbi:hypothetical protein LTR10_007411 [Elasticomyces elasticus]|nr:hypothetical protein LTR10_007411 [Elasticomyces elasticus]KAK4979221.1 hypothetical protein LTR42_001724 [Elasticomyces elasticus]
MFQVSGITLIAGAMMAACLGFLLRHCCERLKASAPSISQFRLPRVHLFRTRVPRTSSALLNLPPELRNRIWEEALVSKKGSTSIAINKHTWAQPLLLRTCKQIRKEAGPMYYSLNTFAIVHTDLDFRVHIRFCKSAAKFAVALPRMTYFEGAVGLPRWDSLMIGAKAVHEGVIPFDYYYTGKTGVPAAADGVLQLVAALKDVKWDKVQYALDMYKWSIVRVGPVGTGWLWA